VSKSNKSNQFESSNLEASLELHYSQLKAFNPSGQDQIDQKPKKHQKVKKINKESKSKGNKGIKSIEKDLE
jgi:hypothetical protein